MDSTLWVFPTFFWDSVRIAHRAFFRAFTWNPSEIPPELGQGFLRNCSWNSVRNFLRVPSSIPPGNPLLISHRYFFMKFCQGSFNNNFRPFHQESLNNGIFSRVILETELGIPQELLLVFSRHSSRNVSWNSCISFSCDSPRDFLNYFIKEFLLSGLFQDIQKDFIWDFIWDSKIREFKNSSRFSSMDYFRIPSQDSLIESSKVSFIDFSRIPPEIRLVIVLRIIRESYRDFSGVLPLITPGISFWHFFLQRFIGKFLRGFLSDSFGDSLFFLLRFLLGFPFSEIVFF